MVARSSEGLLFIATGLPYLQEAIAAAQASRTFLNGRPIAVVTDAVELAHQSGCFDLVIAHPQPVGGYRDKIPPLVRLPYARTLFLDSDARLTADVDPLFAFLDAAHLAAAHAPVRRPSGWNDPSVPALFPELNSGVLLLRRCWRQRLLIRCWLHLYDQLQQQEGQLWDQASLHSVVWQLQQRWGLRFMLLPPEANLRTTKPWIAGKGLAVHVVHGRVPDAEWPLLMRYLNGDTQRFRHWQEWLERYPGSAVRPKLPPDPGGG